MAELKPGSGKPAAAAGKPKPADPKGGKPGKGK